MPCTPKRSILLLPLALGLVLACAPEQNGGAQAAAPAAATGCTGYVGISFDDGPSTGSTANLVNALKANGLTPVTFFNIGQNVAANPSLIPVELQVGSVQNHSYTHSHMASWSQAQVQDELTRTNQAIQSAGAPKPTLFRLPYGESSSNIQAAAVAVGLKAMTWDVDSQDWNNASTSAIVAANNSLTNGQVILMHEWPANTLAAIPQIAANLRAKGLCPGVIDPSTAHAVAPSGGTSYTLSVTRGGAGSGTVTSTTGSINCGSTCSASLTSGTLVTLSAAAASGSTFAGWSGACSGTGSCVVTMSGNQSVGATFNAVGTSYTLAVTKSGTGSGTVTSTSGAINCGSTCSASLTSGTAVTLSAAAASGSTFAGWSGACTGTGTCIVTLTANQSVGAAFTGSVATGNVSINVGGPAVGSFVADTGFSGGTTYTNSNTIDTSQITSNAPPAQVFQSERYGNFTYTIGGLTAGSAQTVTLYFAETYVTAAGQRSFGVSINGASALSAFDIYAAAGGQNKAIARSFSATASASGQVVIQFTNGSANNAKVNGISVAAGGTTPPPTFTLTVTESGSGTVSGSGISCGSTCTASYTAGTAVTLTATPASGSTFSGWAGACSGTASTCVVTMNAAQAVSATFTGSSTGGPCANPVTFTGQSGNFNTTGAICLRTSGTVNGWGCSNFDGRTVSVNGGAAASSCGGGPLPLAKSSDGYTYFSVTAGTYPWASLYTW